MRLKLENFSETIPFLMEEATLIVKLHLRGWKNVFLHPKTVLLTKQNFF